MEGGGGCFGSGCDIPSASYKPVFPRDQLSRHDRLPSRRESPSTWPKRTIQDSSVLDLGQINNPIGLDLDIIERYLLLQDRSLFGGERRGGEALEGARPVHFICRLRVEGLGLVEGAQGVGFGGGGELVVDLFGGLGGGGLGGLCGARVLVRG